jgi:hypothetical protein
MTLGLMLGCGSPNASIRCSTVLLHPTSTNWVLRRPVESALAAAVAVVGQAAAMGRTRIMDRLIEGIQNEPGMRRPAHPPAHDIAGIDVDHEGHVDEPRPRRDVREVRDPQHVRRRRMERPVHLVEWTKALPCRLPSS